MKLFFSPASPFVRKVMIVALERGIADRIEKLASAASPVNPDKSIKAHNPAGRVPTMLLDDGTAIYDSRVICEYLDSLGRAPRIFPARGLPRWKALTLHSLADGILEAAVANRYETVVRPEDKRWPDWTRGMMAKINDSLAEMENGWTGHIRSNLDIGTIAVGCTLGYLDFRYGSLDWRGANPKLAKWYERFAKRPSMKATVPHA